MEFSRKLYLQKLVRADGNGMIKIVTGIRRCGKSYLLFNIFRNYLLSQGVQEDHIIGLALDDRENKKLLNPDRLLDYINSHIVKDGKKNYVILDEVQLVDDFVSVLLSMTHKQNVETYVSGSNSKFLSKDVVTEFRGRGWEIRVHPLSFAEYFEGVGGDYRKALYDYYRYGGLPHVALLATEDEKKQYLQSVFETTYLKDVIERNHLRNPEGMRKLIQVLASCIGSCTNPYNIVNTFMSGEKLAIAPATIENYLEYLQDAFIISEAQRYDVKGRKYIGTASKYYFEDLGIRNMLINFRQQEDTHIMENVIYNELCMRGCSVDVGQVEVWETTPEGKRLRKNLEVDFVVNNPPQRMYIQSALVLQDREKTEKEQRPLVNIPDHFRKIIILGNDFQRGWIDDEGVEIVSMEDFLLKPNTLD
ncbi:MAG: ATP-binding protein [Paludibacteraceae bacterium]|nr:ATP-binding protein [Paludibacteraceae bacterium]